MTSCRFCQDGGHRVGNLLPASILVTALVYECPNLSAHQISMISIRAEILLLPVCENRCPLYSNSTFGFDFDLFIVTGMTFCFCIGVLNLIKIGQQTVEL